MKRKLITTITVLGATLLLSACGASPKETETPVSVEETGQEDVEETVETETEEPKPQTTEPAETTDTEEATETEPDMQEAAEPIVADSFTTDENAYGNSIGNLYNDGIFIYDTKGAFYYYNGYKGGLYVTIESDGLTAPIVNEKAHQYNYLDEKLYYLNEKEQIVKYGPFDGETEILREKGTAYLQLVNDKLYYTDAESSYLYTMSVEGGEEEILIEEGVYFPVVYKDMVIFQRDSDGESLYAMSLEDGEMTKINDVASYCPIVYRDRIYYIARVGDAHSVRAVNLDGSGEAVLDNTYGYYMNIYNGVLYYVTEDNPGAIQCRDLSKESEAAVEMDISPQIHNALNEVQQAYNEPLIDDYKVTMYSTPNFSGKYMHFACEEMVDGESFVDMYFYDMEEDKIIVLTEFCREIGDYAAEAIEEYMETAEIESGEDNSAPAGNADAQTENAGEVIITQGNVQNKALVEEGLAKVPANVYRQFVAGGWHVILTDTSLGENVGGCTFWDNHTIVIPDSCGSMIPTIVVHEMGHFLGGATKTPWKSEEFAAIYAEEKDAFVATGGYNAVNSYNEMEFFSQVFCDSYTTGQAQTVAPKAYEFVQRYVNSL